LIRDGEVKVARGGTIVADPRTLATAQKGIFAGGDAVTGAATVIEAIAAGQRAASSIRRYIQGKELSPLVERDGYEPITIPSILPTEEETQEKTRVRISQIEPKERVASFNEIVSNYSPGEAMEEARRCLRCDLEA
jgi:NADH-quinone oxidoreductase subunit F